MAKIQNHTDFAFLVTVTFPLLLIGLAYPALFFGYAGDDIIWDINFYVAELLSQGIVIFCSIVTFACHPTYRKSSVCNGLGAAARVAFIAIIMRQKPMKNFGIFSIVLSCSKLWAPMLIVNEYFMQNENLWTPKQRQPDPEEEWKSSRGEHYLVEDPTAQYENEEYTGDGKTLINEEPINLSHPEEEPLLERKEEQREQTLLLFHSLERVCYATVVFCMIGSTFFAEYVPFVKFSMNTFWAALLIIQILKVQKAVSYGASLFTSEHSNGLVAALLIGGMVVQLLLSISIGNGLGNVLFYGPSAESLTHLIPLFFHYYNIFRAHRKTCNAGKRMKWAVILMVLQFNILIVGTGIYGHVMPPLVTCARAAGWAAALNFGYVALAIVSPIFQLILQLVNFNIMYHAFHAIHFHKSAATSGIFFSILHVALLLAHQFTQDCKVYIYLPDESFFDICSTRTRVTGIVILFGVEGAWITGYFGRFSRSPFLSSLHFPFACITFFGLFSHSSSSPDYPFGTYFVLASFITCFLVYSLFFFFNPVQPLDVDQRETVWLRKNSSYSFLVVNYDDCSVTPPGSFFLIYSPQKSNLAHFHAHPFPVFSSRNRRLAFLVHGRISSPPSFTQRLSLEKPYLLNVQGPFQGAASSFISYLSSLHSPTDVYLCGWNAGLANIFSILEFLKDNALSYEIKSICCLFNAIHEPAITRKTHAYINNVVREWQNSTMVTIIESENCDLDYIHYMAERPAFANKDAAMNFWRKRFCNRTRWLVMRDIQDFSDVHNPYECFPAVRRDMYGQKILYFCGSGFESEKFHYGEWRPFVETIP
eukprot:Phypoly_transcript_02770.p1 GENE.Phypoly_transcript_02770~~Phypoly_transcript_02770.p1  ORF type:complete len:861 (+),score=101.91 Phypoly_transcript_02770:132-2585(+)